MYIYTEMLFLSGCSDHDIGPSEATVWVLLVGHHPPPAHAFQDFSSQHPLYLCLEVWNLTKNQHTVRTEKGHLLTKVGRSRQKYHGFPPKPTLHLNQSMFCPVFRTWWTSYIGSVAWMVAWNHEGDRIKVFQNWGNCSGDFNLTTTGTYTINMPSVKYISLLQF